MLTSTVRAVERRGKTAGRDSSKVAPGWASGIGAAMGGADMGIGTEGTDRAVGLADTGNMAVLPAAPTLGELVTGVSKLDSPGLGEEPDGGAELLNIVWGDRDDNGGGGEPFLRIRLEVSSSENWDLDGIADGFRQCPAELVGVLGEIGCGELVDGQLYIVGSWAEGSERVVPNRERLVELKGHGLIVGCVGSSRGMNIVCRKGESSTGVNRRREGDWVRACRLPEEGGHQIRGGGGYIEGILMWERVGAGGEETSHCSWERGRGLYWWSGIAGRRDLGRTGRIIRPTLTFPPGRGAGCGIGIGGDSGGWRPSSALGGVLVTW